jgi:hypothetical protein
MQPLYGLPRSPSSLQDSLPPLFSGTAAGVGWRASCRALAEPKPHLLPRASHSMEMDSKRVFWISRLLSIR